MDFKRQISGEKPIVGLGSQASRSAVITNYSRCLVWRPSIVADFLNMIKNEELVLTPDIPRPEIAVIDPIHSETGFSRRF